MSEGIKETKEALVALLTLGKFIAERAKDGLDLADAGALVTKLVVDAEFRGVLEAAVKGLETVPAELADADFQEALDLVSVLVAKLK